VNGNLNATFFSGDGSRLTNVGGNSTCTPITSLPNTITAPGVYCLKSDFTPAITTGNAVEIQADNVVIDLNGYTLDGRAAGIGTAAVGIYAYQRKNITIRHGTVRGFERGIVLNDNPPFTTSQGHLIEDIRADMNTHMGLAAAGRGNIIRNNQVVNTGGSTNNVNTFGIVAFGPGWRLLNNDTIETKEELSGFAYGIYLNNSEGSVVENNRVGNSSTGPGTSYGIYMTLSTDVLVSNNRVTTTDNGVYYDSYTGKYRDNLTSGVTHPFFGGTGVIDAGGNN
jgi:nitrous oxidase accessory protein NosD